MTVGNAKAYPKTKRQSGLDTLYPTYIPALFDLSNCSWNAVS